MIYYNNDKAVAQSLLSFILSENTACKLEEVNKEPRRQVRKTKGVRYMEKLLLAIVGTVLIALGDILKEDSEDKKEK